MEDLGPAQAVVKTAVDQFQTHLRGLGRERADLIQQDLDAVLTRLREMKSRFQAQLTLDLGEAAESAEGLSALDKRRLTIRRVKEKKIEDLFKDWTEWFERTRLMVDDPNPYVDVKAVFVG